MGSGLFHQWHLGRWVITLHDPRHYWVGPSCNRFDHLTVAAFGCLVLAHWMRDGHDKRS